MNRFGDASADRVGRPYFSSYRTYVLTPPFVMMLVHGFTLSMRDDACGLLVIELIYDVALAMPRVAPRLARCAARKVAGEDIVLSGVPPRRVLEPMALSVLAVAMSLLLMQHDINLWIRSSENGWWDWQSFMLGAALFAFAVTRIVVVNVLVLRLTYRDGERGRCFGCRASRTTERVGPRFW